MPTFAETGITVSPQANTASPAALMVCDRPLGYHDLLQEILPKRAALKQSLRGRCPERVEGELPRRPLSLTGLTCTERSRSNAGVSRGKA